MTPKRIKKASGKRTRQFKLLLKPELAAQIIAAAKANGNSLNGEMERRLDQTFRLERLPKDVQDTVADELDIAEAIAAIHDLAKSIRETK
jgi:hypothetical protein